MDSLVPLYKSMSETETGNFLGLSILNHTKEIGHLIKEVDAKTVLDYGCGRGEAYRSPHKIHHKWGLRRSQVTLYDPAFHYAPPPVGQFDVVIASDVMEHIPPEEVDAFIERLFSHARKAVWASICTRPAKKTFPGTETNLHVCLQPMGWWKARFDAAKNRLESLADYFLVETP